MRSIAFHQVRSFCIITLPLRKARGAPEDHLRGAKYDTYAYGITASPYGRATPGLSQVQELITFGALEHQRGKGTGAQPHIADTQAYGRPLRQHPELRLSPMEPRPSLLIGDPLSITRSGSAHSHIAQSLGLAPHRHSDHHYNEENTGHSESHGSHRHRMSYFTGHYGAMELNRLAGAAEAEAHATRVATATREM